MGRDGTVRSMVLGITLQVGIVALIFIVTVLESQTERGSVSHNFFSAIGEYMDTFDLSSSSTIVAFLGAVMWVGTVIMAMKRAVRFFDICCLGIVVATVGLFFIWMGLSIVGRLEGSQSLASTAAECVADVADGIDDREWVFCRAVNGSTLEVPSGFGMSFVPSELASGAIGFEELVGTDWEVAHALDALPLSVGVLVQEGTGTWDPNDVESLLGVFIQIGDDDIAGAAGDVWMWGGWPSENDKFLEKVAEALGVEDNEQVAAILDAVPSGLVLGNSDLADSLSGTEEDRGGVMTGALSLLDVADGEELEEYNDLNSGGGAWTFTVFGFAVWAFGVTLIFCLGSDD